MKKLTFTLFVFILILAACNTTKNIPEGSYLLDNYEIKNDTKIASSDLGDYVRQQPNSTLPLFGKVRLNIYNLAGEDTSKWTNRFLRKMGQPPVIYSASQTMQSANQLKRELRNLGYLDATVDTALMAKDKKMTVTYDLNSGIPYRVRNFTYAIEDTTMARIMSKVPIKPLIAKGDMFNMNLLEEERSLVNTIMRNVGYYNFSKEYVYFKADTTLNAHEVDLYMDIYPNRDSLPYSRYKLNKITVISGITSWSNTDSQGISGANRRFFRHADTTEYGGMTIIRGRNNFLRSTTIRRNNYLKSGSYYSDYNMTRTYEAFSKMGAIKQVNISSTPAPEDSTKLLNTTIILLPANTHWFKAALDGTNSAGDIGVAPSVSYQNQNLFNGGEQLGISLKGAYEFVTGDKSTNLMKQNYYEYGAETSLSVPLFMIPWLKKSWRELPSATTKLSVGLTNQHRTDYTRQFFNLTINYGWSTKSNRIRHGLDLFDINYIRMPWVSQTFDSLYLQNNDNPLLAESYKNQLVARTTYTATFTNGRRLNALSPTYNLRTSLEVAGILPRLITSVSGAKRDKFGKKEILGVAYAEYVKGIIDYTRTFYLSKRHSWAYHAVLGLAYPYGNSNILPFETRFFAGGSNGIRGWSTRSLGPGAYRTTNNSGTDFVNHTGDMKLEFSIENRQKITQLLEFAQFIDAGNIWTLKDYADQPGGQFKLNNFYKEIAASYGVGLRIDLDFLLLRFDVGMKAYDPGLIQSERFVLFKPRLNRAAFHFGIGYPF